MKNKIFSMIKSNKELVIFFVIALAVHIFLPLNWADDAVFVRKVADKNIFEFLNESARPFTDGLTYIFTKNQWLWRILNPAVLTILLWAIYKVSPIKTDFKKVFPICLLAVYPTMVIVDAGFVATTVNYLWAVTFGILNIMPIFATNKQTNKQTNRIKQLLLIPLLVYSTNMQQMCAVLLAVFLFANFYFIFKKSFNPYLLLQFFITLAGVIISLFLNFSGENSRMLRETTRYFPEFSQLNIFEKAELGFSSTFHCMTMETRQAFFGFFAFLIFLTIMLFKQNKSFTSKTVSVFALSFTLILGIYSLLPDLSFFEFLTGGMKHYRLEKAVYSFKPVPFILFVLICLIVIYCISVSIKNKEQKLFAISAFILGLGSRIMMGFSPTVWASGYRTYCIMFISLICICLIIFDNYKSQKLSE